MIKISKRVRIIATVLVIIAVAYFIFYNLASRWNELRQYPLAFNLTYVALFIVILIFFYLTLPFVWSLSLRLLGQKLRYRKILKIWHLAQLVRYIPGNVTFILGRTEVGKKEGIPREKTLISSSLELVLVVIACLTIFLGYILFSAEKTSWLIFFLIPVGLLILHPKIFLPITNFVLKIMKRPAIDFKIKYSKILALFFFVLFTQLVEGIAYAFLLKAIFDYPLTFVSLLKFAAIYEGAWVIGFLSFFTPSGIGVREAALVLLLEPYMPITTAIVFSIFARICCIIMEVIVALSVLAFNKIKENKEKRTEMEG